MTKEELKAKLIQVRDDGTAKRARTDADIENIIQKFEVSQKNHAANLIASKSDRSKIADIISKYKSADCRLFACFGMGIFVKRNGNKATVTFSFLNPADAKQSQFDIRSFKLHALENFELGKYTYEVDWKGRSEFAVYDAFVNNHTKFPGIYKKLQIATMIGIYGDEDTTNWYSLRQ